MIGIKKHKLKMKTDYSSHQLINDNDLLAYRSKMGIPEFWNYIERLYSKVCEMKQGESFMVDTLVIAANRDMFIKTLCFFIKEFPGHYSLNETFTSFNKLKMEPELVSYSPQKTTAV